MSGSRVDMNRSYAVGGRFGTAFARTRCCGDATAPVPARTHLGRLAHEALHRAARSRQRALRAGEIADRAEPPGGQLATGPPYKRCPNAQLERRPVPPPRHSAEAASWTSARPSRSTAGGTTVRPRRIACRCEHQDPGRAPPSRSPCATGRPEEASSGCAIAVASPIGRNDRDRCGRSWRRRDRHCRSSWPQTQSWSSQRVTTSQIDACNSAPDLTSRAGSPTPPAGCAHRTAAPPRPLPRRRRAVAAGSHFTTGRRADDVAGDAAVVVHAGRTLANAGRE